MNFDLDGIDPAQRYKLLVGLIVPRPIAWVTTRGASGVVNAAPFSFFNMLSNDPPLVALSIDNRDDGPMKDTARNIVETGEFVVNLVDESVVEAMHACSRDYPPDTSEVETLGLATAPSERVGPPRLADAPVSIECRLHTHVKVDPPHIFIGQMHWLHTRDGIVDPETQRIRFEAYSPVGRLFANRYFRTNDQFTVEVDGSMGKRFPGRSV